MAKKKGSLVLESGMGNEISMSEIEEQEDSMIDSEKNGKSKRSLKSRRENSLRFHPKMDHHKEKLASEFSSKQDE